MSEPVVDVRSLHIETLGGTEIVDEVGFTIGPGEVLGLVGESGSGKTTVGLALLGHTRRGVRIGAGRVHIAGRNVLRLPPAELRALRGATVAYVPQDPSSALNPALRLGRQLLESLRSHGTGREAGLVRVREALTEVALPNDDAFLRRYPHQLSGGQQQRVALAMTFAPRPQAIVLDEPTTGLDVTTQAHVLRTVSELCQHHNTAALYITHDLAVIANIADRVALMYAGRIVEIGPRSTFLDRPAHPYARRLIAAIPAMSGKQALVGIPGSAPRPDSRPAGCAFAPRCTMAEERCTRSEPRERAIAEDHDVRCFRWQEVITQPMVPRPAPKPTPATERVPTIALSGVNAGYGRTAVLFDVSLEVGTGECVALVGESGSGKTTLARCIGGLHREMTGEMLLNGDPLPVGARGRTAATRQNVQYIFQSPYQSLNPRRTVGGIVGQPLRIFGTGRRSERGRLVREALERVSLPGAVAERYPDQLSGGERQRVAIARAIVSRPGVLICDEITSALDVSVQAAIIDLIAELRREMGLSLLFVTHNLALISTIADRVAVMSAGRIIELGPVREVIDTPAQPYTQRLIADTPAIVSV